MLIDLLESDFQTLLAKESSLAQLRMRAWEKFLLSSEKLFLQKALVEEKRMELPPLRFPHFVSFIDGFFQGQNLFKKVVALPLDVAIKQYGLFLQNFLFKSVQEEKSKASLLNVACHGRAAFLYFPPNLCLDEPVEICQLLTTSEMALSNLQIVVGKNAKVDLVLSSICQEKKAHLNLRIDLFLDEKAFVRLYDVGGFSKEGVRTESIRASLKKESRLEWLSLAEGSKEAKVDFVGRLLEENSSLDLQGFSHLKNQDHLATSIEVIHMAPYSFSKQHIKRLLQEESRSDFQGKINVYPEAQKIEAYQLNNNLLLSDFAKATASPELTILADDVKASHGATFGNLDEDLLFYLRSRGLSLELAKKFLIEGFCKEIRLKLPSYLASILSHS